jgi:NAD(P)-dependent dehydrogenase (short-subunit alcohol dehydrogenase family)
MMLSPIAAKAAPYGVTVNSVSPGYIATEMLGQIDAEGLTSALRLVPMGRYGSPRRSPPLWCSSLPMKRSTPRTRRHVNGGLSME